uniref:Uncharacterized protein n=1 Tax=viral metagenome TaxID=1070528 RepID=A0A6C0C9Y5_9ZZZZ
MPKHYTLIHKIWPINKITRHPDVASILKNIFTGILFHKTISIDNPNIIDYAFKYVNGVTNFHHIKFNDLPYYETNNRWRVNAIQERPI